jgi:hypothetical protein
MCLCNAQCAWPRACSCACACACSCACASACSCACACACACSCACAGLCLYNYNSKFILKQGLSVWPAVADSRARLTITNGRPSADTPLYTSLHLSTPLLYTGHCPVDILQESLPCCRSWALLLQRSLLLDASLQESLHCCRYWALLL